MFLFFFHRSNSTNIKIKQPFPFSVSSLLLLQNNSGRKNYLMGSAPYRFQSSGIAGANPKYVEFQNKRSKEPRWYTITINFDTKEFLLESDEEKRLYKVDLKDLHKHWPLCVGICGHKDTTIEMVFFFFQIISTKRMKKFDFGFYYSWKQFISRKWTSFVRPNQQKKVNELG